MKKNLTSKTAVENTTVLVHREGTISGGTREVRLPKAKALAVNRLRNRNVFAICGD